MNNQLDVGKVSHSSTENDLQNAFSAFGTVTKANLSMDRFTNQPRGFPGRPRPRCLRDLARTPAWASRKTLPGSAWAAQTPLS